MRKGQSKGQRLDPIARWEGDLLLMDVRALTMHLGISERTVRLHPEWKVKADEKTGAPLYDALTFGDRVRPRRRQIGADARGRPARMAS